MPLDLMPFSLAFKSLLYSCRLSLCNGGEGRGKEEKGGEEKRYHTYFSKVLVKQSAMGCSKTIFIVARGVIQEEFNPCSQSHRFE